MIINTITFPILDYLDLDIFWEHPSFENIFTPLTPEETLRKMREDPEFLKETVNMSGNTIPKLFNLTQNPTAKRVDSWPMMAITPEDFENHGKENFIKILDIIQKIWSCPAFDDNRKPEIMTGTLWENIHRYQPEGYDEWMKSVKNCASVYHSAGIMIRPQENITEFYAVISANGKLMQASMAVGNRRLLWAHINYNGFLSNLVSMNDNLLRSANKIGETPSKTFFLAEMKGILQYIFYKERLGLKARPLTKGEIIRETYPYKDFRFMTDIPCIIYENN